MQKLIALLAFISSLAFAGERVIINPENNGDLKIKANVGGTPTDVITVAGTTGKAEVKIKDDGCSSGTVCSGTYTPTLTNISNLSASTAFVMNYMRVGNVVTVSGEIDLDPATAALATEVQLTLPFASNLTAATQLGGTGVGGNGLSTTLMMSGKILADPATDKAKLQYITSTDVSNVSWGIHFTYLIL